MNEPWCPERARRTDRTDRTDRTTGVDWLAAISELDDCDGYVVLAVDPQTGEVDAHGPFVGMAALEAAEEMRQTLDREELDDVVVRVVRWHGGTA